MFYTTIRRLVEDVIEFQDDTDVTIYAGSSERDARMSHYYDRAAEHVFNYRPWWPFRHATTVVALAAGQGVLPANFGGIGTEGYVVPSPAGSGVLPWVEVNYQELLAMRNNNVWPARYQQNRVYALGNAVTASAVSDGVASGATGSTYDLSSAGLELPTASLGDLITVSGFGADDLTGLFTIVSITTPNGDWNITRLDGGPVTSAEGPVAVNVTTTAIGTNVILSGNPADDRSITVYHDVQLIRTNATTDLDKPVQLPGYLHHALLTGTTWHANMSKNDKRNADFRAQFDEALSAGLRVGRLKANRPQQLPMTVGRMW